MGAFHLVQLNIAMARAPLDAPLLADFVAALDPVNAQADAAPGFVWRLHTEDGDATGIRALQGRKRDNRRRRSGASGVELNA